MFFREEQAEPVDTMIDSASRCCINTWAFTFLNDILTIPSYASGGELTKYSPLPKNLSSSLITIDFSRLTLFLFSSMFSLMIFAAIAKPQIAGTFSVPER
jgi:hypothetical protein